MDRELKIFKEWCDSKAFEFHEKAITGLQNPELREMWDYIPENMTDFEIITILNTKIEVFGIPGIRQYTLTNLE